MKLKFQRYGGKHERHFSDDWLYVGPADRADRSERHERCGPGMHEFPPAKKRCPECGGTECTLPR